MDEMRLKEWKEMSVQLKALKTAEMTLRKEICIDLFKGSTEAGRLKYDLKTIHVQAENKINYKLDVESVKAMYEELSDVERDALRWSPELKLREYKKLSEISLLHECVVVKPAAPVLKVVDL